MRDLTVREWQVEHLRAEGLSNKQIAKRLRVSLHTVRAHLRHIHLKLDVYGKADSNRKWGGRYPREPKPEMRTA